MPAPRTLTALLAIVKLGLHASVLGRYGWFRDELYYVACSDRLAWGYVDHPPASIVLLRAWRLVAGDSLEAVRLLAALLATLALVLVCGLTRALGGGAVAVLLAGLAMLAAPAHLGVGHAYSMNVIDGLVWIAAAWLAVDLGRHGPRSSARAPRPWQWLALGLVLGLGLLNKWSVLWLGAGLVLGLLATPARRQLLTPWPYCAFGIVAAIVAPHVLWQVHHGWPTLEFMDNALRDKYAPLPLGRLLFELAMRHGPGAVPIALAGVAAPFWRTSPLAIARVPACVLLVTLVIVLVGSGKSEYLLCAGTVILPAGAVAWERLAASRRALVVALAVAMIATGAVLLPFALPVLSEPSLVAYQRRLGVRPQTTERKELGPLSQGYADMHGWPELVAAASRAWWALSAEERREGVIWAVSGGYGPAAAIHVLGRPRGLPDAISTHNNYWLWGPGRARPKAVVLLGGPRERLLELFERVDRVGTVECRWCMPYENHKPIWIGRHLLHSLRDAWPRLKHFE